jgi:preprotein translocase subunit SecF
MIDIVGKRKIWYLTSGVILGTSLLLMGIFGFRPSIDFTGGSLLELECAARPSNEAMHALYEKKGIEGALAQHLGEKSILIRSKEVKPDVHTAITAALATDYKDAGCTESRFETIGPSISKELKTKSFTMALVVMGAIILYVAWVFRSVSRPVSSWKYGIVTVVALMHDVIVPAGVFAVLGHYFGVEIDILFVTAMLTVMGFSVHDTIVVFDRIRETLQRNNATAFEDTVNNSVNTTMGRSINTSVTVVLALLGLFFIGTGAIKYFSLVMIIGILVGTYSSIFIASPLLVTWHHWSQRKK